MIPPWLTLLMLWLAAIQREEVPRHSVNACNQQSSNYPENLDLGYTPLADQTGGRSDNFRSILGDGGMRDERLRVALESWNFCNRVGHEDGYGMPSPRYADCANVVCSSNPQKQQSALCKAENLVKVTDNELKSGMAFPQGDFVDSSQPDDYAVQKELYLGSLCQTASELGQWHFWMIMLKNGNLDVNSGMCPSTAPPQPQSTRHRSTPERSISSKVAQMAQTTDSAPQKEATGKRADVHPSVKQLPHKSTDTTGTSQVHTTMHTPLLTSTKSSFPCFGRGCMNHPRIIHDFSSIQTPECANASGAGCKVEQMPSLTGRFYGSYDLDDTFTNRSFSPNSSYFQVDWSKDPGTGSWLFHHILRVNHRYPWLMLYLRADATEGLSGGYPWDTRGMMIKVPESPNFMVELTLEVIQGGGAASQFYLLDIGGCWKNDGSQCNGDTATDVTRYSEMIINPSTDNWCKPTNLALCPPYHIDSKTKQPIHRNDTARFPYSAYHYYCAPPNAQFAEKPHSVCDPYSNPQPQELMQLMPHSEWAVHGYPSAKGQGWIGDSRTWTLDVGGLSERLYFYQDPNTARAPRRWTSIDVGTEIYISQKVETAEWIVSDFNVLENDNLSP